MLLVIDATESFTAQDLHIAGYVEEQKKGMVVVVNKWDLVEKDGTTMEEYRERGAGSARLHAVRAVDVHFRQVRPARPASARDGDAGRRRARKRVSTSALNKMLREAVKNHPPPSKPGKWLKFYYATQADVSPPTFVFFCNDPAQVHFSYKRYLENQLREQFGFIGNPLRLEFPRTRGRRLA